MSQLLSFMLNSHGNTKLVPLTLMRIAIGLFFLSSGFNKVFISENQILMLETMKEAGIFFPTFMAIFVALCEMIFGFLVTIGFLTRLGGGGINNY